MKTESIGLVTCLLIFFSFNSTTAQTMKTYPFTAKGSFSVTMKPEGQDKFGGVTIGRYAIDKTFKGDLDGTSNVDMLGAQGENGAGAYVAIERVTANLNGKTGTFLFMHNGTMTKTSQELTITVVPGCGTGELANLEGRFTITMVGKDHFYVFEYSL